ncbi:hypothetical protein Tco_0007358 [Tanacetum coccineum]
MWYYVILLYQRLSPGSDTTYHVYYQENRRHKNFFYLKELLPHVYREDLLLLRRRMNRYFRLNPDVDVGLDLWRDVNLLCQSLHSDDVEEFWRTQDDWVVSSWKLYPKSSVHVLDLTHGKTVYMFVDKVYPIRAPLLERMLHHRLTVPPSYCRDVVVAGSVIQTIQDGLRESYECLASAPIVDMVINPPWNLPFLGAKGLTSPEQTATGKGISNPLMAVMVCPKPYGIQLTNVSIWKLLLRDVAASFDSAVHRVHAGSFDAAVASLVSAAYFIRKGNLLLDLQKLQKNHIFCILVDIRQNTNFVRAFTTSANVPSIYIQLFWNTLTHDAKTGVYSFQVDEHWLTLSANLLQKALNVTPADSAHPFESPPADADLVVMQKDNSVDDIWILNVGSNSEQSHVALAGPNPEHMHDVFLATNYPKNQRDLPRDNPLVSTEVLRNHPSDMEGIHYEDGNPARAYIKQALGSFKDGDGSMEIPSSSLMYVNNRMLRHD